jgi:PAS domain S-box-containing protein
MKILIVDDKPDNLYLLRALLTGHGHTVIESRHGAEALSKARQAPPQLVISDLLMPVMDGYTLLRHWKLDETLKRIPFIVYTATYTEPQDEKLALDLGADAFILKPSEPETFMARLREVIDRRDRGELGEPRVQSGPEEVPLKEYSETLVRKLEAKMFELEQTSKALERDIAGRKEAEASLREAESRLRLCVSASNIGLWDWNLVTNEVYFSPEWKRQLGYAEHEISNRFEEWESRIHPEDLAPTLAKVRRFIEAPTSLYVVEFRLRHKDGSYRWIFTQAQISRDANGKPLRMLGCHVDITERKQAELEIGANERRLRSILDTMFVFVGVMELDGTIVEVNQAPLDAAGLKREDVLGRTVAESYWFSYSPASQEQARQAMARAAEGEVVRADYSIRVAGGRFITIDTTFVPLRDDSGQVAQVIGSAVDITKRKQAEEALRTSEERLAGAIAIAGLGFFEHDHFSDTLYWSSRMREIMGRESEASHSLADVLALVHPDDLALFGASIQRAHDPKGDGLYALEHRVLRRDGSIRWNSVVSRTTFAGEGDARRAALTVGTVMDITERKQAEQRIRQLNRTYSVLSCINQTIVRESGQQTILESACRIAVEHGQFRMAWIGLLEAPGGRLNITAHFGAGADTLEILNRLIEGAPRDGGCVFTLDALQTGQHRVCNDIAHDPEASSWRDAALQRGYRSMASLPLVVRNKTIGAFNLYASEPDFFDADELSLLDELAADISFALEVSRRAAERRATEDRITRQRTALIALASQEVFAGPDIAAALRQVTEAGAGTLKVARVSIWRCNADHSAIECADLFESDSGRHCAGAMLAAAAHPSYFRALEFSEIIAADDALNDPRTCEFADHYLRPLLIGAMLVAPIRLGGVRAGVLCHEHVGPPRQWTEDEKTFAVALANLVSLALEDASRRESQAALRRSEQHFRMLIESASDLITILSREGVIQFQAPASERLLGYTPDIMVGHSVFEWIHPNDAARVLSALQRALTHPDTPMPVEYRVRHRDGGWRTLESIGRGIGGPAAEGFIVINSRDVTEQRQLEEQLRRSQKMEAIGQLAGGVAHDLNNALAPIMMSSELLRLEFPETGARYLDIIQGSTKRGADMVKQLLTFAKGIEGERLLIQPRHLLKEMNKLIRGTFPKNIELRTLCATDLRTVLGDATQLHQVMLNLCVNARDAMPDGGTLTLEAKNVEIDAANARTHSEAQPGSYVLCQVTDTGTGISPETFDHIFEPFFTTKGPEKGTGLGLSTVIGIVKSHGGFVRVSSSPGQGSTFGVYLPASEITAGSAETTPQIETGFRGRGATILVVDDEAAVREVMRAVLTNLNFKVLTAGDGTAALASITESQLEISAVITDMHMPNMDGLAFVRVLKARIPQVGVIVASGRLDEPQEIEFQALGVSALIDKPFTREKLVAALKTIFPG